MATRVVNLNEEPYDLYIGRADAQKGLLGSIWGNPFMIGRDGTRDEVLVQYRAWILEQPELLDRLPELKGKILGCWCKPKRCHGDILLELIKGLEAE